MGYERKLYIVDESYGYAEIIAMIDMCKDYYLDKIPWEDAPLPLYSDIDLNTKIEKDMYGEPIKSARPEEVLEVLAKAYAQNRYWRERVAMDLIRSVTFSGSDDGYRNIWIYSLGY